MNTGDLTCFEAYKAPLFKDMNSSLQKMFYFSPCPCPGARFGDRVRPDQLSVDVHRFLELCATFLGLPKSLSPNVAIFEKFRCVYCLFEQRTFHVRIRSTSEVSSAIEGVRNSSGPNHNNPALLLCFSKGISFAIASENQFDSYSN